VYSKCTETRFIEKCAVLISGQRRIIFLPERSSICQYRPKMSAINVKKQSRARLLLAHPVLYILKIQKTYCTFRKPPFQNQPKSVVGYVRQLALSPKVVQAMQVELSKFNTSYYSLLPILYLQFMYPKIANLILIIYIVCRALGCFKGGSGKRFGIDVIQISTTRRFNWCEALG